MSAAPRCVVVAATATLTDRVEAVPKTHWNISNPPADWRVIT